jgi:hypothetical protein
MRSAWRDHHWDLSQLRGQRDRGEDDEVRGRPNGAAAMAGNAGEHQEGRQTAMTGARISGEQKRNFCGS